MLLKPNELKDKPSKQERAETRKQEQEDSKGIVYLEERGEREREDCACESDCVIDQPWVYMYAWI